MGANAGKLLSQHQREVLKNRWSDSVKDLDKEVEDFCHVFISLDSRKKDGRLDLGEFAKCLGMLGNRSTALAECLFRAIDVNGDGTIDAFEFINWMLVLHCGTFEERVRFGFCMVDADHSNWISREEMMHVLNSIYQSLFDVDLPVPLEQIRSFVNAFWGCMDSNHDGRVDFLEYVRAARDYPEFFRGLDSGPPAGMPHGEEPRLKLGHSVSFGSPMFDFSVAVMLGIETGVKKLGQWRPGIQIENADYSEHFTHAHEGKRWSFCDYAPKVFREIRYASGVNDQDYLKSLGIEQMLGNLLLGHLGSLSSLISEGKSGSFFYFTSDGKYMVKTIGADEKRQLEKMLPDYYVHLKQNPHSLLARFLGLHKMVFQGTTYRFVVMGNCFTTPKPIVQRYDLKGSAVGRTCGVENRNNPKIVQKDLDFLAVRKTWNITGFCRDPFIAQVQRDIDLLKRSGVIDYSLLVGIAKLTDDEQRQPPPCELYNLYNFKLWPDVGPPTEEGFFAIIDYLIPFELRKQMESSIKKCSASSHKLAEGSQVAMGASVVPPDEYGARFVHFMEEVFK